MYLYFFVSENCHAEKEKDALSLFLINGLKYVLIMCFYSDPILYFLTHFLSVGRGGLKNYTYKVVVNFSHISTCVSVAAAFVLSWSPSTVTASSAVAP